jgi:hypothetical protein
MAGCTGRCTASGAILFCYWSGRLDNLIYEAMLFDQQKFDLQYNMSTAEVRLAANYQKK